MNSQVTKPNIDGIPRYMRENARFCFWKLIVKEDGNPTKIPFNPNAPKCGAKTDQPETFGTLTEAVKAYQQYDGDGIGVLNNQVLWGIDIDHCLENGQFL